MAVLNPSAAAHWPLVSVASREARAGGCVRHGDRSGDESSPETRLQGSKRSASAEGRPTVRRKRVVEPARRRTGIGYKRRSDQGRACPQTQSSSSLTVSTYIRHPCREDLAPYPERSRFIAERQTRKRSEKSAEVIVAGDTQRRTEPK
jgi:hypothetical protein